MSSSRSLNGRKWMRKTAKRSNKSARNRLPATSESISAIGCREESSGDGYSFSAANRDVTATLNYTVDLSLRSFRQIANLIPVHTAVLAIRNQSTSIAIIIVDGAVCVPKQRYFHSACGNSCAIDYMETALQVAVKTVNSAGKAFLAGATFARKEDVCPAASHTFNDFKHVIHRLSAA